MTIDDQLRHEAWRNPYWPCPNCFPKMARITRIAPSLVAEGTASFYHCHRCDTHFQVAREWDGTVEVSKE